VEAGNAPRDGERQTAREGRPREGQRQTARDGETGDDRPQGSSGASPGEGTDADGMPMQGVREGRAAGTRRRRMPRDSPKRRGRSSRLRLQGNATQRVPSQVPQACGPDVTQATSRKALRPYLSALPDAAGPLAYPAVLFRVASDARVCPDTRVCPDDRVHFGAPGPPKIVVDPGFAVDPVHYNPPFPPLSPNPPPKI
jgi:hypothetical protein